MNNIIYYLSTMPWHQRKPTLEHQHWFESLVDIFLLNNCWTCVLDLKDIKKDLSDMDINFLNILDEIVSKKAELTPEKAPHIFSEIFHSLMDDTYPEDILGRLEKSILKNQLIILDGLIVKTPTSEKFEFIKNLSKQEGNYSALRRWPNWPNNLKNRLETLPSLISAVPFLTHPKFGTFLTNRATATELILEYREYPNTNIDLMNIKQKQMLFELFGFWIQGFVSALCKNVFFKQKTINNNWQISWSIS